MKRTWNLAALNWTLSGYTPHQWAWGRSMETGVALVSEIPPVPAKVPGSVQAALRAAGIIPDWNMGLNARQCEWVEHRHWMFETVIPDEWLGPARRCRLRCLGLDGPGWVMVNGRQAGVFANSFIPHDFELTQFLRETQNRLQIVFDCPPRWLGQLGYTSQITEWKPRFNYTWDWTPRLVQIGIWDSILIDVFDREEDGPRTAKCRTTGDTLHISTSGGRFKLTLSKDGAPIRQAEFEGSGGWDHLPVERWWPNGAGAQPLYAVTAEWLDTGEKRAWRVGFKSVEWQQCEGAPSGADPWLCVINGQPIFLQGVNWTPIRPNFADVSANDYRKRLQAYRDMGCNLLRVWGGAVLEKDIFYDLCDELGLLVWQEFPLSSSGLDNWPPEDPRAIEELADIAASYIARRQQHASLLLWCGGNELQGALDGNKAGIGKPVDGNHPLIARLARVVAELDPHRRFLPTSASGPRFTAEAAEFGQGLHWDVHGPWRPAPADYWTKDDALFRSEVGAPGASPVRIIREYAGGLPEMPASVDNPLWRLSSWWIQWPEFLQDLGRAPRDLEEFAAWSRQKQADALTLAVKSCKLRFPRCGGVIVWMGHDCFPCAANTAILDFNGDPKPAATAVERVFRSTAAHQG